ncbi:hypothetical protein [Microvirga sp. BSC39]|uniref:DUF6894 family protein n=1 Tax=Microvirga sp. BSC39 TaxID=1549810 RepID=UPI000B1E9E39|nr:hypothetical protein [Microvirga sp. BSC39]
MRRYFFDTFDGERLASDEEGLETQDFAATRVAAQKAPPEMPAPTAITAVS